ncbi:uncharacterized protein LOC109706428 [Ananas comosus]|uniref:Uncharacterized protein LOC109706428 n=1 Tax=Ananas comosus TaxID=4615 RepID=A0A6P5ENF6_ANACO|nr:uncharacterized protein LOC109706428 [Ananas comosus]
MKNDFIVAQIYVDDIVFGATKDTVATEFAKLMTSEFEMSMMSELSYFLGLQVKQLKEGIHLSQTKYAKELVKKFGLDGAKNFDTPMGTSNKGLGLDVEGQSVDEKQYRSMIGSLLYLTASRPDIAFSVGICACYQVNPKEVHLKAVKRIIRYVKGTTGYGLWYPMGTSLDLIGYSDADWAGSADDRKAQVEHAFI